MDVRQLIIDTVNDTTGIKAVELICRVAPIIYESDCRLQGDITAMLEQLVKEGEVVELELLLPHANDRIKSMYFPKGTELRIMESNHVA